ncbi:hypothetical protein ACHAXT_006376 [Thalassiosira profunda]
MTVENRGMVGSAKMRTFLLLAAAVQIDVSSGFLSPSDIKHHLARPDRHPISRRRARRSHSRNWPQAVVSTPTRCAAADSNANSNGSDGNEDENEDGLGLSALPAIGASSFWENASPDGTEFSTAYASSDLARPEDGRKQSNGIFVSEHTSLVSPKFQLQYTCKKCDTRNSHSVTRIAYRKGVVIAQCKGCFTKHWIADNLGWSNHVGGFDFDNGETDIEMYMQNQAREKGAVEGEKENDLVMRVTQDVFDLETILYKGGERSELSANNAGEDDEFEDGSSWN